MPRRVILRCGRGRKVAGLFFRVKDFRENLLRHGVRRTAFVEEGGIVRIEGGGVKGKSEKDSVLGAVARGRFGSRGWASVNWAG